MTGKTVDTQIIANLVVQNLDGEILFVRYDRENEKWWLPGRDVEPFTHPDDAVAGILREFDGIEMRGSRLSYVDSFRGRRGWHVMFNYDVRADGLPTAPGNAKWFPRDEMPRTMHGDWEKQVVAQVLAKDETSATS